MAGREATAGLSVCVSRRLWGVQQDCRPKWDTAWSWTGHGMGLKDTWQAGPVLSEGRGGTLLQNWIIWRGCGPLN